MDACWFDGCGWFVFLVTPLFVGVELLSAVRWDPTGCSFGFVLVLFGCLWGFICIWVLVLL